MVMIMNSIYNKLMKCYDCFQKKINFTPEIALVLGSGLGNYASKIKIEATLDYHDIDGFPVSTVPGDKLFKKRCGLVCHFLHFSVIQRLLRNATGEIGNA